MNAYAWKSRCRVEHTSRHGTIRGKLAFKTKETEWVATAAPVVALVSVFSAFHNEESGDLKMNAFLTTIKSHTQGKVTVLLSDRAHLRTLSLNHQENVDVAFDQCLKAAQQLEHRYRSYFEPCQVVYWHSYIYHDPLFHESWNRINDLFQTDSVFQTLLYRDVEASYTQDRMQIFTNKELYIKKASEDILEQCASLLVLSRNGYRFVFYPGEPFASTEYAVRVLLPEPACISWINVFLSIEQKLTCSARC